MPGKRQLLIPVDEGHPMHAATPFTPILDALRTIGLKFPPDPIETAEELAQVVEVACLNYKAGREKARREDWDEDGGLDPHPGHEPVYGG